MIKRCTPGYWLRILPDDDDHDSIWHAALIEWDIAITALVHVGLIKPGKKSGKLTCNIHAWESIRDEFGVNIQTNHFRARENTKVQHFICVGPPRYKSPHDQVKDWPRIPIVPCDSRCNEVEQFKRWRDAILDESWASAEFLDTGDQDTGLTERLPLVTPYSSRRNPDSAISSAASSPIAKAASTPPAHDNGPPAPAPASEPTIATAPAYDQVTCGTVQSTVITPSAIRRRSVINPLSPSAKWQNLRVEGKHPGYLRVLWRFATKTVGNQASFTDLANCMNMKSQCPSEGRPSLSLHHLQVWRWFQIQKGVLKAPSEKPRLTEEHTRQRLPWARDKLAKARANVPMCFLDEKWFYTTTRRRKIKFLSPSDKELDEDDRLAVERRRKVVSRRYAPKVMYLGVVAKPDKDHNFDGRIYLERIARKKPREKAASNQRFATDSFLNDEIKSGLWRELYIDGMTTNEFLNTIGEHFELEEATTNHLSLQYETYVGENGNTKKVRCDPVKQLHQQKICYSKATADGDQELTIHDVKLEVYYPARSEYFEDVSCDSAYMIECMTRVGPKIREAFHWVTPEETIYLIMDNAGGHGTDEAVTKYKQYLKDNHNITIIYQVPRSPETNLLDLGIWRSVQAAVEKANFFRTFDAESLALTVSKVWEKDLSTEVFKKVYRRWCKVLGLILEDNGRNDFVEKQRGKLFSNPIDLTDDDDDVDHDPIPRGPLEDDVEVPGDID